MIMSMLFARCLSSRSCCRRLPRAFLHVSRFSAILKNRLPEESKKSSRAFRGRQIGKRAVLLSGLIERKEYIRITGKKFVPLRSYR